MSILSKRPKFNEAELSAIKVVCDTYLVSVNKAKETKGEDETMKFVRETLESVTSKIEKSRKAKVSIA